MNPKGGLAKIELSGVAGTIPEILLHFSCTQRTGLRYRVEALQATLA
jgi:hypothetical protein